MGPGREIPNFFIFAIKVVRLSPSLAAAPSGPPMTQPVARSACTIAARVESLNVPCAWGGVTGLFSTAGTGFGRTPSLDLITARSIRFCSSRMFPGQEYELKAASVSGGM